MSRRRTVVGIVAAAFMLLSSGAHSLLGWPVMRARLVAAGAPADLTLGLGVGWVFGGVCMLTFSLILLWTFRRAWRGLDVSLVPVRLIAAAYAAFGIGAMVASGGNPFYFVFIVPGLLLFVASPGTAHAASAD